MALLAIIVPGAAAIAEPELKGTPSELQSYLQGPTRTITLVGHAKDRLQPESAVVTILVKTQAKELATALDANAARRASLVQGLGQAGIDASKIRASRFSATPQTSWFGKTSSYEVANRMKIPVADERQLTALARIVGASDELQFGAIDFEYPNRDAFEDKVRQSAFDDALTRKRFYEDRFGTTMRPVAFRYSDNLPIASTPNMELQEVIVTGSRISGSSGAISRAPTETYAAPTPAFDELVFETWATVTFELARPAAAKP